MDTTLISEKPNNCKAKIGALVFKFEPSSGKVRRCICKTTSLNKYDKPSPPQFNTANPTMFYKPSTTKLSQKLKYDTITQEKQGWRQILNKKIGWVYFYMCKT